LRKSFKRTFQSHSVFNIEGLHFTTYLAQQARQHFSGSDIDERRGALRDQQLKRSKPARPPLFSEEQLDASFSLERHSHKL